MNLVSYLHYIRRISYVYRTIPYFDSLGIFSTWMYIYHPCKILHYFNTILHNFSKYKKQITQTPYFKEHLINCSVKASSTQFWKYSSYFCHKRRKHATKILIIVTNLDIFSKGLPPPSQKYLNFLQLKFI